MVFSAETVTEVFRKEGRRMTPQRRAVIDALTGNTTHPFAEDVAAAVQKSLPDVSLSTVYSILEELAGMGLILKIPTPKATRFDPNCNTHAHLYCRECGDLLDIPLTDAELAPLKAALVRGGQELDSALIEYRGVCNACLAARGTEGRRAAGTAQ